MSPSPKKEFDWFDHPRNRRKLWIVLYALCGLSVLAEFAVKRKGHFSFDGFFGFYALLGFVACLLAILLAKGLGWFLKVKEDYYDNDVA